MRTYRIVTTLLVTALAACSTIDNAKVDIIPPEIAVQQLGGAGLAGSRVTGPISVNLRVRVFNPSGETLTLQRLDIQSVAFGAYTIESTSRPFGKQIKPSEIIDLETWVPATANDTIVGSNGPVTLRVNAYFDSDLGKFKKIYTVNINTDLSPLGKPREQ